MTFKGMQIITASAMQNTMTGMRFFIDKMLHHAPFLVKALINDLHINGMSDNIM